MIDNGFCFNAGEWDFPDAALRALCAASHLRKGAGIDCFGPWLTRSERMDRETVGEIAGKIQPEGSSFAYDALDRMLEPLARRHKLVRDLMVSAWKSSAQHFSELEAKLYG
jgi:hypothetical protein